MKHYQVNYYTGMVETCIEEKESRARRSKHQPLKANTIINIIKKGK